MPPFNKFIKVFDILEEDNSLTKNKFAQDLQRNWEDRKVRWREIGGKLEETNKYYQELTNNNINQTENNKLESKQTENPNYQENEKRKDNENFAEPQWVKEKITAGETDLNELKNEYQQFKEDQIEIVVDNQQNKQQAQIIQQKPFGTPSSSK